MRAVDRKSFFEKQVEGTGMVVTMNLIRPYYTRIIDLGIGLFYGFFGVDLTLNYNYCFTDWWTMVQAFYNINIDYYTVDNDPDAISQTGGIRNTIRLTCNPFLSAIPSTILFLSGPVIYQFLDNHPAHIFSVPLKSWVAFEAFLDFMALRSIYSFNFMNHVDFRSLGSFLGKFISFAMKVAVIATV